MRCCIKSLLLMLITLISFSSCSTKEKLKAVLADFIDSEVIITDDLLCLHNGEISKIRIDTLCQYKFIIYYDSLECSSCRIANLLDVYPIYDMGDKYNFSVLTIFAPGKHRVRNVELELKAQNHPIPVYIDPNDSFARINTNIPSDKRFHSFLIDGDGVPLLVGNPILNPKIEELFTHVLPSSNIY